MKLEKVLKLHYIDRRKYYDKLAKKYNYEFLGEGRHRRVYGNKYFVLKLPMNTEGYFANQKELKLSKMDRARYAPCKNFGYGLLMIRLNTNIPEGYILPQWTEDLDCQQVGFYKDKLLAYDYA